MFGQGNALTSRSCHHVCTACVFGYHASLLHTRAGCSALYESFRAPLFDREALPSIAPVICARGSGMSEMITSRRAPRASYSKMLSRRNLQQRARKRLRTTSARLQDPSQRRTLCGELQWRLNGLERGKIRRRPRPLPIRQPPRLGTPKESSITEADYLQTHRQ